MEGVQWHYWGIQHSCKSLYYVWKSAQKVKKWLLVEAVAEEVQYIHNQMLLVGLPTVRIKKKPLRPSSWKLSQLILGEMQGTLWASLQSITKTKTTIHSHNHTYSQISVTN